MIDSPKTLRCTDVRSLRFGQLRLDHMSPLTAFVEDLRDKTDPDAQIPYFDPLDGGVSAEVLFLLEAPGPKAVATGFISRNNPDETAKNIFDLTAEAGLARSRSLIWNVVPWYIGTGKKIRAANRSDLKGGLEKLPELLELLPKLKAIVLLGRKAERSKELLKSTRPDLEVFVTPHPSPLYVNRAIGNRDTLKTAFCRVREFLDRSRQLPES